MIGEKMMKKKYFLKKLKRDKYQYVMLLPAFLVTLIFAYIPMFGLVMAFQNFSIFDGFLHSEWVGLDNFIKIFTQSKFTTAIWNTLLVSVLNLLICFPAPIILALLINELEHERFKKVTQTISYLPHFLSWISVVGLATVLLGRDGVINDFRMALGAAERVTFLSKQELFLPIIVLLNLWKETGWGTVIHLANLSSINPELYEAASVDGATRLQKIWFITLPHMIPTVMILLIFKMGTLFASNFELIYGLQNPFIDFEVISTIIYQTGIKSGNYSVSTAIGFAEGLIALLLVFGSNWFSKKTSGSGII